MEFSKTGDVSGITMISQSEGTTSKTPEAERRRILRKVDIHLLPWVILLYILSFLDRINIGNAKIVGMVRDAHLTGFKLNISKIAAAFFISYALAEIPSNIILIARIFLGLAEAGLFPGIIFYLSLWYRRDFAFRIAIFLSAATAAGTFSGFLAFGIGHMEGIGGLHGWQWIFCLEGLATIVIAALSFFMMYDYPDTATFLSPYEKEIVINMLKEDTQGLATHYEAKFVWQALSDYKPYILSVIHLGLLIPGSAIALFLPTIINTLGYSAAIFNFCQFLLMLSHVRPLFQAVAYFSDKCNLRGPFVIGGSAVSLVGFIILTTHTRPEVGYVGTIITAAGGFPAGAVFLTWVSSVAGGDVRKGVTIAFTSTVANFGGVCSSFIYHKPPHFFLGHGTCIGMLTVVIILASCCMWDFWRLNKAKEADCAARGLDVSQKGDFIELGSESPLFRFMI